MEKMRISERGAEFIKGYEGLRLKAYRCPAGVWTIGYGHTRGVKSGQEITIHEADKLFVGDIKPTEALLNNLGINFTQGQFDALCSWIFNLGSGNFTHSTMCKYIVADKPDLDITDQMVKWVNSNGKPLLGLVKRRLAEANMFLGGERYYLDKNNNIKRK